MPENRRKYDDDFKDGAVRIVLETGRPVAEVARELDVHEGTLGNWVNKRKAELQPEALSESERDELNRLRKRVVELEMERNVLISQNGAGVSRFDERFLGRRLGNAGAPGSSRSERAALVVGLG